MIVRILTGFGVLLFLSVASAGAATMDELEARIAGFVEGRNFSLEPAICNPMPVALPERFPAIPWFPFEGVHKQPDSLLWRNFAPVPGRHAVCLGRVKSKFQRRQGFALRFVERGQWHDTPVPVFEKDRS